MRQFAAIILIFLLFGFKNVALGDDGFSSFKRSLNDKSYGYSIVSAPNPIRAGQKARRFELRSGDCGVEKGWSDCDTDRSRSELVAADRYYMGDERWFAWSIFLDPTFQDVSPTKTTLGQIHQFGGPTGKAGGFASFPPLLQFDITRGNYVLNFHDLTGSRENIIDKLKTYNLISLQQMRGKWTDIVLHIKFEKGDGFLEVFVNGKSKAKIPSNLIRYDPQYFYYKFGIYNSFISRFENTHKRKMPTQIVYFDEVRVGKTRESVDPRINPSISPVD